jgi:hypothetical protein
MTDRIDRDPIGESRQGQSFARGTELSVATGDRLILLDCQSTPRPVIDEFLKAYLAKYPSDL